jgi:UDPglucose 6-dehydrogenase
MQIAIFGSGLQATVAKALLASAGNHVIDFDEKEKIDDGFNEPGLKNLYKKEIENKRIHHFQYLEVQNTTFDFVLLSEIIFEDIKNKNKLKLLKCINDNTKFIILSPSKVGEAQLLSEKLKSLDVLASVCSVPLLVREGKGVIDFSRPEVIIIGCDDMELFPEIKSLFLPFDQKKSVIKFVSTREAEFSCFAGNAMLATRLSFMNEMASLAERIDVDIDIVRDCIGRDPRIGSDYLFPGCGYGGKVLTENVTRVAHELHLRSDDLGLLDIVSQINERQKDLLFRKIWRFFKSDLNNKTIAIWGAAFKPESSSIEGSPAIKLIESLLSQHANVQVYDPYAKSSLKEHFDVNKRFTYKSSSTAALIGADVLVICTGSKEFMDPNFDLIRSSLTHKVIFDGRNIFSPFKLQKLGFKYFGVGRGDRI